jgi:glucose-1-phosphate thymidylyltransferase
VILAGVDDPALTVPPGDAATARVANLPIIWHAVEALRGAGAESVAVVAPPEVVACVQASLAAAPEAAVAYLSAGAERRFLALLAAARPFVADDACLVHAADGMAACPLRLPSQPADLGLFVHHGCPEDASATPEIERLLGVSGLRHGRTSLGMAELGYFGPGALRRVCEETECPDAGTLGELAAAFAAAGGRLQIGRVGAWLRYRGCPGDLLTMNRVVLDRLGGGGEPVSGAGNRIEGRVQIARSARVEDSVISGPVVIGERAHIRDSYIGPYTSIGHDAEITGSEVEHSIVADGACLRHVGTRVQGSTVGPGARVFRDFGLPRAMRMHLGAGVELALA